MAEPAQKLVKQKKGPRRALGRGLSALISPEAVALARGSEEQEQDKEQGKGAEHFQSSGVAFLPASEISPNPTQPRRYFDDSEIADLASSISEHGLIQPILVRKIEDRYEIVAGERRWRAATSLGLSEVPVIVKSLSNEETLKIALVENVQRQQLNPIEEAMGYQQLTSDYGLTQEQVAQAVGKSRAVIANALRLLRLPKDVVEFLQRQELSVGHAKVLLSLKEAGPQSNLAQKCMREQLSVRELEELVSKAVILQSGTTKPASKDRTPSERESPGFVQDSTTRLRNALGTRVSVRHKNSGKGKIEIEYFSEQELDRLLEQICQD
jgi:ParB family transcriptional regulator, chromosome partitioning protein